MINLENLPLVAEETYFVYDLNKVTTNVVILRGLFKDLDQIYFSVKSNPSGVLLQHLAGLNINFDVSSENELSLAHKVTNDYEKITVSGPAKTDAFLKKIKTINLKSVHLDSMEEYHELKTSNSSLSVRWPLESTYSQKVGLPIHDLHSIVKECAQGRKLSGVHIYIGRERATKDFVQTNAQIIKKFMSDNKRAFVSEPSVFWGAGLPLAHHVESGFFPSGLECRTHLECGRSLVHDAGVYVTQVLEVRQKADENILIINGGLQHLATHFGSPRYGQDDVIVKALASRSESKLDYTIYGSLGISTDVLVKKIQLSDSIKRGDWLAIGPCGGYGLTAGSNQFLGPHRAREIFFVDGKVIEDIDTRPNYLESGLYEYKNS